MILKFVESWEKHKNELKYYFTNHKQSMYSSYSTLVKIIIEMIINADCEKYQQYDVSKMTIIDDGDYQGTMAFVIPRKTYQPIMSDYIYTYVDYGSCSCCDTLLSISQYGSGFPNQKQVEAYMMLSLHLLQHFHYFEDD